MHRSPESDLPELHQATLSAILESSDQPIFAIDRSYCYTAYNAAHARAMKALFGTRIEIGANILDYHTLPEERATAKSNIDRALLGESVVVEHYAGDEAFERRYFMIVHNPVRDTNGAVAGVTIYAQDLTEQKRAAARLEKEAKRSGFLLELHEKSSRLTERELYGYALDEAVMLTNSTIGYLHLVSDDQQEINLTLWNKSALEGCTAVYDSHYPIEKAGNWADCVRTQQPVVYNDFPNSPNQKGLPEGHAPVTRFMTIPVLDNGKVKIIFGVGNKAACYDEHDVNHIQLVANELHKILEQRRVEAALRESAERLDLVLKASAAGTWDWDVASDTLVWSPQLFRIFGLDPSVAEASFAKWDAALRPEDREPARMRIEDALREHRSLDAEYQVVWPDGQVRWIHALGLAVYDDQRQPVRMSGICMDITERKRAEQKLERSELRYRTLYENSLDGILLTKPDGTILTANPQACRLLGMTEAEIIAAGRDELVVADDALTVALEERTRKGRLRAELTFRRKDGSTFPCEVASGIFTDTDGLTKTSMVIHDITERVRAEDERRKSEEKFRVAFMSNPNPCYLLTMNDGVMVEVNSAYEALYGYAREECIGRSSAELNVWENYSDRARLLHELESKGFVTGFRSRSRLKSGEIIDVQLSVTRLNLDGKAYLYGVVQDITEQLRAAHALSESERQYRTLIDFLPVSILVHRDGIILLANHKSAQSFGVASPEQLIGTRVLDLVHPDDRPRVMKRVLAAISSGQLAELERETLLRKNGESFAAQVTGMSVVFGDRPAVLVVFDDISEKLASEEARAVLTQQLRQSQKMEAVGRLAGGVAHDFNNLLTVITGHTELALLQLRDGDPLRPEIEEIARTAQRAANLTRQLLAFSRRQIMAPVILDLNHIVSSMDRMLKRIIGENIHLETSSADDLWNVKADPGQIEQVIANLAVNARDAMPRGGAVTIETLNVTLDSGFVRSHPEMTPGPYVLLSVTDTGIGISPEIQARIFEPFFTTKPLGEGTGLGLATVYGIVKQSGGHILVESEEGLGTTFNIYLPAAMEAVAASEAQPVMERRLGGSEFILLIEDSATVRKVLTRALEGYGYRVMAVGSAEEAFAAIPHMSGPADLVLTDVILPGLNGVELAGKIRQLWPTSKILLMSGYTADVIPEGTSELELELLQKPFGPAFLVSKVRTTLDR
jgi:PAS domain S-box-containing protein